MPYILENMTPEDIPQVASIERQCFSMPWPISAYRRELKTPETNRYIVARFIPPADAVNLRLPVPEYDNLTALSHPELQSMNGHSAPPETHSRSILESFIPWLRRDSRTAEGEAHEAAYKPVGYAGLWLMVDEAHVTTIGVHPDHRGQAVGELLFLGLSDIAREMRAVRVTLEVRVSNYTAQALYRKYGLEIAGVRRRYYSDNGEDAYIMWSEPIASAQFQQRMRELRTALVERMRANYYQVLPPARAVDRDRLQ